MHAIAHLWALTLALAIGAAASQAAADVPNDPKLVRPLPVGAKLPDFTVRTVEGAPYRVSAEQLSAPLVLIFYRGGWCPYCNTHLGALRTAEPKLAEMGYTVLFLSADRPEMLRSSLKEPDIGYTLLSDSRMQAARAFGIAFEVDDATVKKYLQWGIDLEKASGESHHQLPVPSVFIVDRRGTIRYVYSNPDYRVRIEADDLLSAAKAATEDSTDGRE